MINILVFSSFMGVSANYISLSKPVVRFDTEKFVGGLVV